LASHVDAKPLISRICMGIPRHIVFSVQVLIVRLSLKHVIIVAYDLNQSDVESIMYIMFS